tara:strand:+ start:142 stop:312 length:171 start_codon:yes stop_codon:yes gene_type:complete
MPWGIKRGRSYSLDPRRNKKGAEKATALSHHPSSIAGFEVFVKEQPLEIKVLLLFE